MKKIFFLLATLLASISSFALSDMVSVDFPAGSRTVPIEDLKDMYYSNTKDSLFLVLEDTTYAFKADSSLHVAFLDSIEGQHKREREALIAIYKALDGDNWEYNENWCSDKPVGEWFGVRTLNGFVDYLYIVDRLYVGERVDMPEDICNLVNLKYLAIENTKIDKLPEKLAHSSLEDIRLVDNIYLTLADLQPIYKINGLKVLNVTIYARYEFEDYDMYQQPTIIPDEVFDMKSLEILSLEGCNLSGEIPERIGQLINLRDLSLYNKWVGDMYGSIPKSIANLQELYSLALVNLHLSGGIPDEIYSLVKLRNINLFDSNVGGEISEKIGNLINLEGLDFRDCDLSGELPKSLAVLLNNNLELCLLGLNNLSGEIPEEIYTHPKWRDLWSSIIEYNNFTIPPSIIPAPKFDTQELSGKTINSDSIYQNNKYTIIFESDVEMFPYVSNAIYSFHDMHRLYNRFHSRGLDIVHFNREGYEDMMRELIETYQITWHAVMGVPYGLSSLPNITVVDSLKEVVFATNIEYISFADLESFFEEHLPGNEYMSSDYSKNMQVDTLQLATIGNGIDIVLMGDAYSDRQIADSTYHKDMLFLYDNLFTEEPYKSCKDMFNVYYVNVVSKCEGYDVTSTALGGFFGNETEVGGNDAAVIEYASQAVPYEKLDNAIVIVAMNSNRYAGTCYMYYPTFNENDFGTGLSISYFPKGGDPSTFAQLLHHEALGHGFAKLADEYAYEENGAAPESTVALHQEQRTNWGWWKNIDFTNDSSQVLWSKFLSDDRYQYDGLGVFEGGLTYWTGVWRPTENSIMRYNFGGFNAPSREAIYYRIHKLAYGKDWEFDYEKFVEWDAKNRKKADSPLLMPSREAIRNFVPTHPPVIKQMNWREALEDKQAPKKIQSREKVTPSNDQSQGTVKYVITTKK